MITINDQDKELYLLKTGIVLSVSDDNVLTGEYNDGLTWQFRCPSELTIYPNSKVQLYRYYQENEPAISNMLVIMDPQTTFFFVIGSTEGSENLIRHGISQTTPETYWETIR